MCIIENGVDEVLGKDYNYLVDEEFEEVGNNYFESEPIFDISDIEEDCNRLNFSPKFDVNKSRGYRKVAFNFSCKSFSRRFHYINWYQSP